MTTKVTNDEKIGFILDNMTPELHKLIGDTRTTISTFPANPDWPDGGYIFAVDLDVIKATATFVMDTEIVSSMSKRYLLDNAIGVAVMNYNFLVEQNANQGN